MPIRKEEEYIGRDQHGHPYAVCDQAAAQPEQKPDKEQGEKERANGRRKLDLIYVISQESKHGIETDEEGKELLKLMGMPFRN